MEQPEALAEDIRDFFRPLRSVHRTCVELRRDAPVAQLDRAPGFEPGGRRFESVRARQFEH